jgi:hypothetical protein
MSAVDGHSSSARKSGEGASRLDRGPTATGRALERVHVARVVPRTCARTRSTRGLPEAQFKSCFVARRAQSLNTTESETKLHRAHALHASRQNLAARFICCGSGTFPNEWAGKPGKLPIWPILQSPSSSVVPQWPSRARARNSFGERGAAGIDSKLRARGASIEELSTRAKNIACVASALVAHKSLGCSLLLRKLGFKQLFWWHALTSTTTRSQQLRDHTRLCNPCCNHCVFGFLVRRVRQKASRAYPERAAAARPARGPPALSSPIQSLLRMR